ncbi:MAG: hypothetical protein JRN53_06805, partial [Nitrososphaerota archaeon]|nr:hypothetical protein [Nitrososphaerota archaeon]
MDNQEDNNPYSHNPGEDWNKANRSGELKKQEDSFYHKESSSKTGGKILDRGGLYHAESNKGLAKTGIAAAANITPVGRALKYVGNHKKGAGLFGGGITGLILLFVAFFGFLGAHELITIEQDMMRYEEKGVSYIEKKAGQKLFQTMACRKMPAIPGCKKVNEEDGGNDPAEQDADPMAAEMDQFSFSDPKIIEGLKSQNIEVNFDKEGNPSGFTDLETGQPITASDLLDPEYITRFQDAIPQWQTSQEETLRPQVI